MMTLFDIKRYSINDGPGVRTTVFLKGCPLRCVWCHNPESWTVQPQKTYKQSKCIGCNSCVEVCSQGAIRLTAEGIVPVAGARCVQCGRCVEECPTTAMEMCGRTWTMDELMTEIEKERDIMLDSGGGVTLCGGEPLMQADACIELLRELGRRGFHRAVDTTLHADSETVAAVAAECELMLVDLKLMDPEKHRAYTGVDNRQILDNLSRVAQLGQTEIWIRIPLIDGINADEANIDATAHFLADIRSRQAHRGPGITQVNLLPYHDVGRDKHRRLWSAYNPQQLPLATPSEAIQQRCLQQFAAYGIPTIIGG